jgi:hypothetical protein
MLELQDSTLIPFTGKEVEGMTANLKDKKAAGPNSLYNEHLEDFKLRLLTIWIELFNRCMELGTTPQERRYSTVKVL